MKNLKSTILTSAMLIAGIATVKAQSADEIFTKHYDAVGGTAWDKVTSLKQTGTMTAQGMEITMTNTFLNKKAVRSDISVMGTNGYQIITPTEGWSFMPMMGQTAPEAMKAEDLKNAQDEMDVKMKNNVDIKAMSTKAEVQGKEKVGDAECFKVKVVDKDNQEQTMFFDSKTFYLVCIKAKVEAQGQSVDVVKNYSDFKKLDSGIVIAMKEDLGMQGSITYKEVEVNKPVDESIFKPSK
jgi:hypothetical protein